MYCYWTSACSAHQQQYIQIYLSMNIHLDCEEELPVGEMKLCNCEKLSALKRADAPLNGDAPMKDTRKPAYQLQIIFQ